MDKNNKRPSWQESDRLEALRTYNVLDTPPEPAFDGLVGLAAQVCGTPMAAINLLHDRRQWFKAEIGLGVKETALEVALCAQAILQPACSSSRMQPRTRASPPIPWCPAAHIFASMPVRCWRPQPGCLSAPCAFWTTTLVS